MAQTEDQAARAADIPCSTAVALVGELVPRALDALAHEIRQAHQAAGSDFASAVDHARRAGDGLIEAKAQVRHGEWLPWLEANFEFTRQTAADYMRLAVKCSEDTTFAPRSIETGLRAIASPSEKTTAERLVASDENEWYTPTRYIEHARAVLGAIDLDPASCLAANQTVRAGTFFTAGADGLERDWQGRIWLNPPYGRLAGDFTRKLLDEYSGGNVTAAIVLVNAHCTDTSWFAGLWDHTLCFTDHRIDFDSGDRGKTSSSTHGSVFAYLGPDPAKFADIFSAFGAVVSRWSA